MTWIVEIHRYPTRPEPIHLSAADIMAIMNTLKQAAPIEKIPWHRAKS